MEENSEYTLWKSLTKEVTPENQFKVLEHENELLKSENASLEENLKKERIQHQILYNQWKQLNTTVTTKQRELEQLKWNHNPKRNVYRYTTYGLLIISVLLAAFNFNIFSGKKNTQATIVKLPVIENKIPVSPEAGSVAEPPKVTTALADNIPGKNYAPDPNTSPAKVGAGEPTEVIKNSLPATEEPDNAATKSTSRYQVRVQSYFHDEPDITTRRHTFVLPSKGDYGIIHALDDKNGFIYIVFVNRAGRTSKGWILKKDLDPLYP